MLIMKVKFSNGVCKVCSAPTEQKVFKSANDNTGWVLHVRLIGEITSTEIDELLISENIGSLEFLTTTEDGEVKSAFTLAGYDKVTSSTIRHAEDTTTTIVEIQLTKGL